MSQQSIEQVLDGRSRLIGRPHPINRAAAAIMDAVSSFFRPLGEALGGPWYIEQLDRSARAQMSEREKGEINAGFHGI